MTELGTVNTPGVSGFSVKSLRRESFVRLIPKDFIGHMTDGDRDFKNGVCQLCFGLLSNFGT